MNQEVLQLLKLWMVMKKINFKLNKVNICLKINKKEFKKDLKEDFIKQFQNKNLNILKNFNVEEDIKREDLYYGISADNGNFIIINDDMPFHAHITIYFQSDEEFKGFSKLVSTIGNTCEEVSKHKIKSIQFLIEFSYLLDKNIELKNFIKINNSQKVKNENELNKIETTGIELYLKDNKGKGYIVTISNYYERITVEIGGRLISKKEKKEEELDITKLYELLNEKIDKLITYIYTNG